MPVRLSSVLLIPGLLSDTECATLITDVERHHAASVKHKAKNKRRIYIPSLSPSTHARWEEIMRERLLPLVSKELPAVEVNFV